MKTLLLTLRAICFSIFFIAHEVCAVPITILPPQSIQLPSIRLPIPFPPIRPPIVLPPRASFGFKVTDASVSPSSLSIPCGIFSCSGFQGNREFAINIKFAASLFDPIFSRNSVWITNYNLLLLEDDLIFDNPVGLYAGSLNKRFIPGFNGLASSFSFNIIASSNQLNPQCAGGCNSRSGYLAEAGALEFILDKKVSYIEGSIQGTSPFRAYLDGSPIVYRTSEPSALVLFCIILVLLGFKIIAKNRIYGNFSENVLMRPAQLKLSTPINSSGLSGGKITPSGALTSMTG